MQRDKICCACALFPGKSYKKHSFFTEDLDALHKTMNLIITNPELSEAFIVYFLFVHVKKTVG